MGIIFWIAFFILIISLFFINRNLIQRTINNTNFLERLFNRPQDTAAPLSPEVSEPLEEVPEPDLVGDRTPPEGGPQNLPLPPLVQEPAVPVITPSGETPESSPESSPRVERRDRALYFMQVDQDGMVLRMRVNRSLAVSDSPMTDALLVLLAGPSPEEQRRGLVSFIPPETELLSVMVRGTTAYINLNQEFLFSTFGVEGYAAQLRQIVWTATEFSTVRDVQILIEGKRVDYLGESILIGSPITRDMLP
jgi:hypothetical protein